MKTAIFEIVYVILVFYVTGKIFLFWLSRKISLPERNKEFFMILSGGILNTGILVAFSASSVNNALGTANDYVDFLQLTGTYLFLLVGASVTIFIIASYIFRLYAAEIDLINIIKKGETGKIILWTSMIIGLALSSGIFIGLLAEHLVPYPVSPFHL